MWAQMITVRLKPGKEDGLVEMLAKLDQIEQPGSGLLRQTALRSVADPLEVHLLVVFESEAKARERERDPRREAGLAEVRAQMDELLEGSRSFAEFDVVAERTYGGTGT